jgi:hypothetical protein
MRKLNGMYQEYLGSLEFKCDYFTPDLEKIKEKQECCVMQPGIITNEEL